MEASPRERHCALAGPKAVAAMAETDLETQQDPRPNLSNSLLVGTAVQGQVRLDPILGKGYLEVANHVQAQDVRLVVQEASLADQDNGHVVVDVA